VDRESEIEGPRQLRDERIETGLRHLVYDCRACKGRVRDKPYTSSPPFANRSRQFESIEDGHVQVQEHDVGKAKADFVEGLRSVVGDPNGVAKQGHDFCERLRYVGHVIDDEDIGHGCDVARALNRDASRVSPVPL